MLFQAHAFPNARFSECMLFQAHAFPSARFSERTLFRAHAFPSAHFFRAHTFPSACFFECTLFPSARFSKRSPFRAHVFQVFPWIFTLARFARKIMKYDVLSDFQTLWKVFHWNRENLDIESRIGHIQYWLCWHTFGASQQFPGSWSTIFAYFVVLMNVPLRAAKKSLI